MIFEQIPEGSEGGSHVDIWEKRISGKEKTFKGLDAEGSVVCLRNMMQQSEHKGKAGTEAQRWRQADPEGLTAPWKHFGSHWKAVVEDGLVRPVF